MNIGLLGYGRMGKAIEKIALERGHKIVYKLDRDYNQGNLDKANVAINFSTPSAAVNNIITALESSIPVICGTTGWLDHYKEVTQIALHNKTAFLFSSNFSIGVNLFFKLNKTLAKIVQDKSDYKASIEEIHHIHKLDTPSGTAITLAEGILENSNLKKWCKQDPAEDELEIRSKREGEVPGIHTIQYKSSIDSITIRHEAFNRKGFAFGALIAAEWIVHKKGIFKMDDVLNF